MKIKFDHVGIVVRNIEKAIAFYSENFGWFLPKRGPYSEILNIDVPGEKIRYALLVSNDNYIELVEPEEGLWMKCLEAKGEGAICELCVTVDNIESFRQSLEEKGITPMNRFNQPLEEKYMIAPSGARYFYLPLKETSDTWIEILERPWKNRKSTINRGIY